MGSVAVFEWRAHAPNGRVWHLFEVVTPEEPGGWTVSLRDEDGRELLAVDLVGSAGRAAAVSVRTPAEGVVALDRGPLCEVGGAAEGDPAPDWPPSLLLAAAADGSGRGLARHCSAGPFGDVRCDLLWTGVPGIELELVLIDSWTLAPAD